MKQNPTTYLSRLAVVLGISLLSSLASCNVGQQGMIPQISTQDSQNGNAQRNAKEAIAQILAVVEEDGGHHGQAASDSSIWNTGSLIISNKIVEHDGADTANVANSGDHFMGPKESEEEKLKKNASSSQQRKGKVGQEKPTIGLTSAGEINRFITMLNEIVKNPDLNNEEKLQRMKEKNRLPQVLLQKNEHKYLVLEALVKLALTRKSDYKKDVKVIVQAMDQIIADAPVRSKLKDPGSLYSLLTGVITDPKLKTNNDSSFSWLNLLIDDIKSLPENGRGQDKAIQNNKFAQTKSNLRSMISELKQPAAPARIKLKKSTRGGIFTLKSQKSRKDERHLENTYESDDEY